MQDFTASFGDPTRADRRSTRWRRRAKGTAIVTALVATTVTLLGPLAPARATAPTATNLGYLSTGEAVALAGGGFAFPAQEYGYGDLNGDGDVNDWVLHVHDPATGTTTNAGISVAASAGLDDGKVAFAANEAGQDADLNGDGDRWDWVLHVYDPVTGAITNSGLAGWRMPVALAGGRVGYSAAESMMGADLNGDGTLDDEYVTYVYDPNSDTATNFGLASNGDIHALAGGRAAFLGLEPEQGADLNGDGDRNDAVLHVHDPGEATAANLGIAVVHWLVRPAAMPGIGLTFSADEFGQGADLNTDGDSFDRVLHLYDVETRTVTNTEVAAGDDWPVSLDDTRLLLGLREFRTADYNGDGDRNDTVMHTYDVVSGALANLGQAGSNFEALAGGEVAFYLHEYQNGIDHNGDGDTSDTVFAVYDPATGSTFNSGLASYDTLRLLKDGGVAFRALEYLGTTDLNGDGDKEDWVYHVYDPATGVTNLDIASSAYVSAAVDGGFVFPASESDGRTDYNGDSDTNDDVLHVYDTETGVVTNLGLASANVVTAVGGSSFVFAVSEAAQGADLNGDANWDDDVVHLGSLDAPVDADGDGYSPGPGPSDDADDSDATVFPGAPEVCDTKDNDQDGGVDEDFACDADQDGLDDDADPDTVAEVVAEVPRTSFGSGGQPRAFASNLDETEQLLLAGDVDGGVSELEALRLRVDGCTGTSGERADRNDWITACGDQRTVRVAIDSVIEALEA